MLTRTLIKRARNKAKQSSCRYKIAAIGLNRRGEVLTTAINKPRFGRKGGGLHAEMIVMRTSGPGLKTVLLCRVNASGDFRQIHPCKCCRSKAQELGVEIIPIEGD